MSALLEAELHHRVGAFDLAVQLELGREIGVLFGPSGAGKSLTLRLLAGSELPRSGRIRLAERTLLELPGGPVLPARRRRIALVHQHLSLFPHLSVLENVAYGLRGPGRRAEAGSWLGRLRLAGLESRYPQQLSGGQQQRVALARALAVRPELLLLDEPFSALDGPLRRGLRRELRRLQREMGIPVLYVSHQIEDVCALGSRITLIREGRTLGSFPVERLWQAGAQAEAWPALGWGNLIRGRVQRRRGGVWLSWPGGELELPPGAAGPNAGSRGLSVFVAPRQVKILYPGLPVDPSISGNVLEARVEEVYSVGHTRTLYVSAGGLSWHVEHPVDSYRDLELREGSRLRIAVPPQGIAVLAAEAELPPAAFPGVGAGDG
jgi:molybdate transport system ATP-binding protein